MDYASAPSPTGGPPTMPTTLRTTEIEGTANRLLDKLVEIEARLFGPGAKDQAGQAPHVTPVPPPGLDAATMRIHNRTLDVETIADRILNRL